MGILDKDRKHLWAKSRGDIAKKVGVSKTAVQKHVNKLKSIRLLDREGPASHGHWIIIEN